MMLINESQKPWTRQITEEEWARIFGKPLQDRDIGKETPPGRPRPPRPRSDGE